MLICIAPSWGLTFDTNQPKTIIADKLEYDVKSETIKTTGRAEIVNQSGQRMTITDSYISQKKGELSGDDIKLWLGHNVYIDAETITRDGVVTRGTNAHFTACDGCDEMGNAWTIYATRFTHDMDSRMMSFHNPILRTYYDIPLFWFPYITMPDPAVKHKTGFLYPDFESTNNMGTQINIPFYIYLSPQHDMTVKLSYLTRENPLFQAEHRLNATHSEFRTRGSFTHNRDGENRWHISNRDVIELGEHARATVFLERASDKTYLQKYGFYEDQPYLDSGAKLEIFGMSGYVVSDAHIFQELRESTGVFSAPNGNILPNIRGLYQTAPLFDETFAVFNTDILGISGSDAATQRVIGDARIISPWTLWGGNRVTASLSARYDVYNFSDTQMIDGDTYSGLKNRFLPSGYVEWSLPLTRPSDTWGQIIEPRARLTVMRHIDNEQFATSNDSAGALLSDATLFSMNRFSGFDLWENGTFADYGIRWATFNPDGHMVELFAGQTYDFTERADTDPNSGFHNGASDYVGRISYNNMQWLELANRFRLARDNAALRHMETSAVIGGGRNFLSVGHIWSRQFIDAATAYDTINEFSGGLGIGITKRWSIQFDAIYNATYGEFHRHSGNLFYNHPCYFMAIGYRRDNAVKRDYVGTTTYQFRFGINIDGKKY
ncbi:MAG: LPS-assembly protein LptD [Alphaproteobacteria bacterium]|nr:LPS-assembly protein LptD [Alphaproteobacteria bacterium]